MPEQAEAKQGEVTGRLNPFIATWPLRIRIQISPTLTCVPCVPTRVKKPTESRCDRDRRRPDQAKKLADLEEHEARASRKVTTSPSQASTAERLACRDDSEAKPKVVLRPAGARSRARHFSG